MQEEIWKEVPSYPGLRASSWGRIWLPVREYPMPNGGIGRTRPKPTKGIVTKASKNAMHVYYGISNRYFGNIKVHRAVCEAFHGPAPFEKAVVIHIDEDGLNNNPDNLKWGTQKENLNMPKIKAYHCSRTGDNNPHRKGKLRQSLQQRVKS